ncbi:MAG: PPC domain-containing protein [Eubacteriales bacterium]
MKKNKKWILIGLSLIALAGLVVFLFCCNQENFTGNRVKNPDSYFMDIENMNGTDFHTLELNEGDTLRIHFETERGLLYMEIKAPDGTDIYCGNGKELTDFTVNIPQSGIYTILVEARHAKGSINIQLDK